MTVLVLAMGVLTAVESSPVSRAQALTFTRVPAGSDHSRPRRKASDVD